MLAALVGRPMSWVVLPLINDRRGSGQPPHSFFDSPRVLEGFP